MKCPACAGTNLVMTERSGIEIDYCPECRGVWLDRGELDKIIERSANDPWRAPVAAPQPAPQPAAPPVVVRADPRPPRRDWDDDDDDYKYAKHKKKKGLLGEIFDF